jgi:pyruvate formate lyase activating enzyme
MENLKRLAENKCNIIARIPVVPGFNHTFNEMGQIIDSIADFGNIKEVHFLPYHSFGNEKYKMLGRDNLFEKTPMVKNEELTEYITYAQSKGLKVKTGG